MKAKTKTIAICLLTGMVLGGLIVAAHDELTMRHHYNEWQTFFAGK